MRLRPDGLVDSSSEPDVAAVVDAVLRTMGTSGILDLLARLPGVRVQPGSSKRFLAAAVPATAWVGVEDGWVVDADPSVPLTHVQSVSGVVLHRQALGVGRVGAVLGAQLVRLAHEQASLDETAVVLSGAWESAGG